MKALPPALDAERTDHQLEGVGRISVYHDAPGRGPALLLIHSINAAPSAFEMKPLFDHFRASRDVYAMELPGFGHSGRGDRVYSPALFEAAIRGVLDSVIAAPADAVGFSLSSEFLARAADHPRLRSLALISPTGMSGDKPPASGRGEKVRRIINLPGLGQALFALLTSRPSIRWFLNLSFEGEPPQEMVDYAWRTAHQPGARHAPFYFISGQLFTRDAYTSLYSRVTLPALVLYDRDANVGFDRLDELVASRANWHKARIAPTLGLPHWEQPAATFSALDHFWRKTVGKAG